MLHFQCDPWVSCTIEILSSLGSNVATAFHSAVAISRAKRLRLLIAVIAEKQESFHGSLVKRWKLMLGSSPEFES